MELLIRRQKERFIIIPPPKITVNNDIVELAIYDTAEAIKTDD